MCALRAPNLLRSTALVCSPSGVASDDRCVNRLLIDLFRPRLGKGIWIMSIRYFVSALAIYAFMGSLQTQAQESLVTYKSLTPEIALDLARAALADCQKRGYQVAVAVADRFGVVQVVLRDRYAGSHTPATATGKAWTAATFRNSTSSLFAISQPGMMQAGIRNLPGVVIIGGGLVVESAGSLVGAIGVSGAPGGDADEACARAAIDAIQSKLDF